MQMVIPISQKTTTIPFSDLHWKRWFKSYSFLGFVVFEYHESFKYGYKGIEWFKQCGKLKHQQSFYLSFDFIIQLRFLIFEVNQKK